MCSVVTNEWFGSVCTNYPKEYGNYIVKFTYNTYNLQDDFIIDGRIVSMGEQAYNFLI